jgi:hypothetical protein
MGLSRKVRAKLAPPKTEMERWRRREGLSYGDLGELLSCSRQYAEQICKRGMLEAVRMIRVMVVTKGELTMLDLLTEQDRWLLVKEGFIKDPNEHLKDPPKPVTTINDDHLV